MNSILSIDYCENRLGISLSHGQIRVYTSTDLEEFVFLSDLKVPPQEVLKWNGETMATGSCDGDINMLQFIPKTGLLVIRCSQNIHKDIIKDIIYRHDIIYTCSIDNYVNILRLSIDSDYFSLIRINKVQAHNGWVTGFALLNDLLLSQGSDNTYTIWKGFEMKKIAQLKYTKEEHSYSLISKPNAGHEWFLLADTQSQIDGDACVTAFHSKTFQIVEISLYTSPIHSQNDVIKENRLANTHMQVQCSVFTENGFIVAASNWILFYSLPKFIIRDEYQIDSNSEINVIPN